jgi:hypothetical protein
MLELLTMKSQWRRDMERMLAERDHSEQDKDDDTNDNSNKPGHVYNTPEICT